MNFALVVKEKRRKSTNTKCSNNDENCSNNSNQPTDVFDEDTQEEDYLAHVMMPDD